MIPEYLQLAIEFEKKLITLRKHQIDGYEERIKLMEKGSSYGDSLKKVPGRYSNMKFEWDKYHKLKKLEKKSDEKQPDTPVH